MYKHCTKYIVYALNCTVFDAAWSKPIMNIHKIELCMNNWKLNVAHTLTHTQGKNNTGLLFNDFKYIHDSETSMSFVYSDHQSS